MGSKATAVHTEPGGFRSVQIDQSGQACLRGLPRTLTGFCAESWTACSFFPLLQGVPEILEEPMKPRALEGLFYLLAGWQAFPLLSITPLQLWINLCLHSCFLNWLLKEGKKCRGPHAELSRGSELEVRASKPRSSYKPALPNGKRTLVPRVALDLKQRG